MEKNSFLIIKEIIVYCYSCNFDTISGMTVASGKMLTFAGLVSHVQYIPKKKYAHGLLCFALLWLRNRS